MTPKEKAKELIEKIKLCQLAALITEDNKMVLAPEEMKQDAAKRVALICCDEMLRTLDGLWADIAGRINQSCQDTEAHAQYWKQVKQEIGNQK